MSFCEETRLWLQKYFCEGQYLFAQARSENSENNKWYTKHRRIVGMLIPFVIVHVTWWSYMISTNSLHLFTERVGTSNVARWNLSITMIFGSLVGGATSEGGGSVAFPVMTLVFGLSPVVARDFSFMIQSVGMTSASFCIIWMRVKTEIHSIIYCTIGGTCGIIYGLKCIVPHLDPPFAKMYFCSIWFAFAISLFLLNRVHTRRVYDEIPFWESGVIYRIPHTPYCINWKAVVLIGTGFLGGIFSAISGSGIDICSFAFLTLLFRVSEKIATPTSVILMAINTLVGFVYREYGMGGVQEDAWGIFAVCIPIVVIGAPLGSVLGSHCHRLVLACFVYIADTVQLIAAIAIIKPWTKYDTTEPKLLCVSSAMIIVSGAIFFRILVVTGEKLMDKNENKTSIDDYSQSFRDSKSTNSTVEFNNRKSKTYFPDSDI